MESKLDRQTDSYSDYSAHLRIVQNFFTKPLKAVVIDNFDLHIFFFFNLTDFVIFGIFYVLILQAASSPFCTQVAKHY